MTIFDDIVLGTDPGDPDRPVVTFSETYHRLRPNEVAGTGDVDALNAIMRERLGDDWADILIPQRPVYGPVTPEIRRVAGQ